MFRFLIPLSVLVFALTGCATKTFSPAEAPEFVITQNFAPFYRMGPMQPGGPTASLPLDTRVKVMSQEMGYSRVQLEDLRTGYVANENMAPAPPRPPEVASSDSGDSGGSSSGRKKRGSGGARYSGPEVNDTPLPDPMPLPDLNIGSEVVSEPTSTPTPAPEAPKFRY